MIIMFIFIVLHLGLSIGTSFATVGLTAGAAVAGPVMGQGRLRLALQQVAQDSSFNLAAFHCRKQRPQAQEAGLALHVPLILHPQARNNKP